MLGTSPPSRWTLLDDKGLPISNKVHTLVVMTNQSMSERPSKSFPDQIAVGVRLGKGFVSKKFITAPVGIERFNFRLARQVPSAHIQNVLLSSPNTAPPCHHSNQSTNKTDDDPNNTSPSPLSPIELTLILNTPPRNPTRNAQSLLDNHSRCLIAITAGDHKNTIRTLVTKITGSKIIIPLYYLLARRPSGLPRRIQNTNPHPCPIAPRSKTNHLPVYTVYKAHGTKKETRIRHVRGDAKALAEGLSKHLQLPLQRDAGVWVNHNIGHVMVKGHFAPEIMEYLNGQGF
ncbi:hypothetical protein MKZ38_007087 [Zalerion maritima]|uniref:Large ribosomal subunit protein mL49 n=1 Tax=Zalerion maritima TaxID=339359 RepID=A0AAD5RIV4_9PEZI|nr:hypothetical protein MKZ38_007087 [Zalerion maritima]